MINPTKEFIMSNYSILTQDSLLILNAFRGKMNSELPEGALSSASIRIIAAIGIAFTACSVYLTIYCVSKRIFQSLPSRQAIKEMLTASGKFTLAGAQFALICVMGLYCIKIFGASKCLPITKQLFKDTGTETVHFIATAALKLYTALSSK